MTLKNKPTKKLIDVKSSIAYSSEKPVIIIPVIKQQFIQPVKLIQNPNFKLLDAKGILRDTGF